MMLFIRKYLLPRIIQYFVVIVVGATVVFIVPRLTPSDPIEAQLERISSQGQYLDPVAVESLRSTLKELYGLEGSVFQQNVQFWRRMVTGDFGPSFSQFPTPVAQLVGMSMPWTAGLLLISTVLSWLIGTILGGLAGSYADTKWAQVLEVLSMTIRPIPYYIMALFMVIVFAYLLPWFPMAGGYTVGTRISFSWRFISDVIRHGFLPALSLIVLGITSWFLTMRSVTSNVVREDYVLYAEAAGLSQKKIVTQYIMRNSILPQITGLALSLGTVFGGALITETLFSYPGIGTLLYTAAVGGDYNLIMGITLLSIVGVATAVLIIDLVYPFFDPRVRY